MLCYLPFHVWKTKIKSKNTLQYWYDANLEPTWKKNVVIDTLLVEFYGLLFAIPHIEDKYCVNNIISSTEALQI
jgi:hypothetical protein